MTPAFAGKASSAAGAAVLAQGVAEELAAKIEQRRGRQQPEAHQDVRGRGPVDLAAAEQELLVDRLEQVEVEVAAAHQVGELAAVAQEQRLDQPAEGEVTADEEVILVTAPARDRLARGLRE